MTFVDWLKSKWQWIAAGLAVLVAMLIGASRRSSDDAAAVAFAKLKDADAHAREAEKKATALNAEADRLAREFLSEQIRLEAEKEKMKNAAPSDVDSFLRDRGAIK